VSKTDGLDERLAERRREVEERFSDVRTSIDRELGIFPKAKYGLMGLAAAAAGFALAAGARRRRKKKRLAGRN
jgi:hypothetical protein